MLEYGEEYVFGLFSVYVRLILIVFWVEMGDKIFIICVKIGYFAVIIFYIKVSEVDVVWMNVCMLVNNS